MGEREDREIERERERLGASSCAVHSTSVDRLQGDSGCAMRRTKAVDKLPQALIIHCQSMVHGEFMSCLCLGVMVIAKKAMSCFFWESLFRACFPRK